MPVNNNPHFDGFQESPFDLPVRFLGQKLDHNSQSIFQDWAAKQDKFHQWKK